MSAYPFPITGAKIHPPLLRPDTLSRPRLNDWMDVAVRGRVVLVVAEAGFGKTTFLADWASRTARRTAWYRLEPDDADWLTFLRHLVASGRELDPDFAAETLDLLLALGSGGPKRPQIIATLVREYTDFAASLPDGLTLILDDQHVIEGSPETTEILRALVDRTGSDFSIVIASRAAPRLPLGRLRSRGSLSQLDGEDLCFDVPETDRLFREAYRRPLEPDVVVELIKRTDGWAALLTLVRTSLEDKNAPEARALVAQLSATRGDLYDFLAEEVMATLSPPLQHFLTRVSVLVAVDADTGSIVDDRPAAELVPLITEAEALGLLSRPDRGAPHRFHPLVRDFLLACLTDELGVPEVQALHRKVAVALEPTDWLGSAWHYRAAGDPESAARVIDAAVPTILAVGSVELAAPLLDGSAGPADRPAALILRSRLELSRGNLSKAERLGHEAARVTKGGTGEGTALLNLAALLGIWGFGDSAVQLASDAQRSVLSPAQSSIARAYLLVADLSREGDLQEGADSLRALAAQQDREGLRWYRSVTLLNLAATLEWAGDPAESLATATKAEIEMSGVGSRGVERAAVMGSRAMALAQLNRMAESEAVLSLGAALSSSLARNEVALEAARVHVSLGSLEAAEDAWSRVAAADERDALAGLQMVVAGQIAVRKGETTEARRWCEQLESIPSHDVAGRLRTQLLRAHAAIAADEKSALTEALEAERLALVQRSPLGRHLAGILVSLAEGGAIHGSVLRVPPEFRFCLSHLAEVLAPAAPRLSEDAWGIVSNEADGRPERWRGALLSVIAAGALASDRCASLLVRIGTPEDAARLRSLAAGRKVLRQQALAITERHARPVMISDLGHVEVQLGGERLRIVRRKVLALVCFLASRPAMAATRDEVLEALWPELGPETATNSLHQTIYFLRRVFEPDFREGLSAGYVTYDGEVVVLSPARVDSSSRACWRLLTTPGPKSAVVPELLSRYRGRFALDFAYEDWAGDYRDTLHAAVLAAAEAWMAECHLAADYENAIQVGHRVLALDPEADGIELALLRSYRASGRHAAAAEQYTHYATFVRTELGAEPPLLEDI